MFLGTRLGLKCKVYRVINCMIYFMFASLLLSTEWTKRRRNKRNYEGSGTKKKKSLIN